MAIPMESSQMPRVPLAVRTESIAYFPTKEAPPPRPPLASSDVSVSKPPLTARGSDPGLVPKLSTDAIHSVKARRPMSARPASSATARRISVDPLLVHGYMTISPIANGAFSQVVRARHLSTKREVAVKTFSKARYMQQGNEHLATAMKNEIDVLRRLQASAHPHIANLCDLFETKSSVVAMLEYCDGGSLRRCLQKAGGCDRPHSVGLGKEKAKCIAFQLASGIAHVHSLGIAHRDVKPENALLVEPAHLQPQPWVKLCDFGFAVACGPRRVRTVCGTPHYMAPEIAGAAMTRREAYDGMAVDVWAFGAVTFEVLEGKPPFRGASLQQISMRILAASHEAFSQATSPVARNLLKSLFVKDPTKRPTAQQVLSHDWFAGMSNDEVSGSEMPLAECNQACGPPDELCGSSGT